jgi:hypothetical protein
MLLHPIDPYISTSLFLDFPQANSAAVDIILPPELLDNGIGLGQFPGPACHCRAVFCAGGKLQWCENNLEKMPFHNPNLIYPPIFLVGILH